MCLLVYVVLVIFPIGVSILLLHGVFVFQIAVDVKRTYSTKKCVHKNCQSPMALLRRFGYNNVDESGNPLLDEHEEEPRTWLYKALKFVDYILENWVTKSVALLLQCVGFFVFLLFWSLKVMHNDDFYMCAIIGLPVVVLCMSVLWSNLYQEGIAMPTKRQGGRGSDDSSKKNARYKSGE